MLSVDDDDEESDANTDASRTDDEGGLARDLAVVIDADANEDAANVASRLLGSLVSKRGPKSPLSDAAREWVRNWRIKKLGDATSTVPASFQRDMLADGLAEKVLPETLTIAQVKELCRNK